MSIYKIKRSRHLLVYFKHALNRNYFYSKSWTLWNLSLSLIILPWVKFHHISFTKFWLYDLKNKTKQNIVLRSIYFAFVGFPKIIAKVIDNWLISNCRSVHTRTKASWKTSVHQSQPTCTILVYQHLLIRQNIVINILSDFIARHKIVYFTIFTVSLAPYF